MLYPKDAKCQAIFLDRDGVINQARVVDGRPYPPPDLASMEILPGVAVALHSLAQAGFLLIVATNQPDVARGISSVATVEAINNYLLTYLPLTAINTCYHDDNDGCDCRKPAPGLLLAAAYKYNIILEQSYMIGDRWRDIEAGQRAGCRTIFIDYSYKEQQPLTMDFRVKTLTEAAQIILGERM